MRIEVYSYDGSPESEEKYQMILSWAPDDFSPAVLVPKRGVIVYDGEQPICFMAADMSNSTPRAFIGHLQTNPEVPYMKRYRAVELAEKFLSEALKEDGFLEIIILTKFPRLACLSQNMGYQIHEKPVILAFKHPQAS